MGSSAAALVVSTTLFLAGRLQHIQGHLYLMTPISRNLYGTTAFVDTTYEYINFCPHCYQSRGPGAIRARAESLTDPAELALYGNGAWPLLTVYENGETAANGNYLEPDSIAVRHGICGDPEQTADEGSNRFGNANSEYPVLETFTEGSVLEVKIVVSTTHHGHLEFFLCDTSDLDDPEGVVTQGCFNMHPLDRAEDDGDASPIDPNFPGRYFLDPTCRSAETDQTLVRPDVFPGVVVTGRYQLPSGVTCSHCIVQMAYYTGNSCKHPGYDEFNPPSWPSECAPNKADWILTSLNMCGVDDNYPEEYWNCADIAITSDGTPSDPTPAPSPTLDAETLTPISSGPGTPAPIEVIMEQTPAPTAEIIPDTPAPTAEIIPDTPAPTNEVTTMSETPAPTADETMPETPPPSIEEAMTETPTPVDVTMEQTPAPTAENIPDTLAPTNEDTAMPKTPAPSIEEAMTETPTPVDVTMEQTPAPTAEITADTPAPLDVKVEITPAPTAEITADTPAPLNVKREITPAPTAEITEDTPAPLNVKIEITPAPTAEIIQDTPAPTPEGAEPFNEYIEPIINSLPPATFAPSVVATVLPPDECEDPVAAYSQCDGPDYEGSTCCRPGYECSAITNYFSECRPIGDTCSEGWGQCGGTNWEGPTCCWPGAFCLERNEWYSQCVPEANA